MNDSECIAFLQWALPKMGLRWPGFRRVRGQVCKRVERRIRCLGCEDVGCYRTYLQEHPQEWQVLDSLCYATVSRFFRDGAAIAFLRDRRLPELAATALRHDRALRVWSAGCCCGEEPYSIKLIWELAVPSAAGAVPDLEIVATDAHAELLEKAARGVYPPSSLRDVPESIRRKAFRRVGGAFRLRDRFRSGVRLQVQDIRREMPEGRFDLILCRYLVFTYFDENLQRNILDRLQDKLHAEGTLMIGSHETFPGDGVGWKPLVGVRTAYRKPSGKEDGNTR
jgi:chemotaxis protein methyltransferase CheR